MRSIRGLSVWIFMGFLIGADGLAGASGQPRRAVPSNTVSAPAASRQVLVTFVDERKDRVPIGEVTSLYRQRGVYSNSTWSKRYASELAADYGLVQKAQWPITALGVHCVVYEVPAPQSVEVVLRKLGEDQRVESAQSMKSFHVMSSRTGDAPVYSDPYFRMQSGLRSMRIETVHRYATGRNVTIAVIDTGADANHPELLGRVTATGSFVPTSPETATDIHGTAVSGIIAATAGNGLGIVGIAPNANLRVMKACWQISSRRPDAICNTFTLALALNTAIDERPQIINMSLNGPSDPLLQRLIAKALSEGIIIVASEAESPGPANEFPASIPGVIPVRKAVESEPSSLNGRASIAAPGTEILTTVPQNGYSFMTGSSFAAAHVSGLIALLLELNHRLNSEQIGSILRASTRHTGNDPITGTRLDACNAVTNLLHLRGACSSESELSNVTDVRPAAF